MSKSQIENKESNSFKLNASYKEARPVREESQTTSCTSSMEMTDLPLCNTIYISSSEPCREITIDPIRIKRSLEALKKNRALQKKGLG